MTQSAASQRISHLEKRLGVVLIDRSVRPLGLTEAGSLYLKGCQSLIDQYDELERQVSGLARTSGAAEIVVDAIYSAGIDLLSHVKDSFEKSHPRTRVVINYKRPDEVHEAVTARTCDLGIVSYPKRWHDVAIVPLRNEIMVVVCAPNHPLAGQDHVKALDLQRWSMVTFEASLPVGEAVRKYLRDNHSCPEISNVFDNIDTIKTCVADRQEFSILPRRTVLREVANGSLVKLDLEPKLTRPIGVIHPRPLSDSGTTEGKGSGRGPEAKAFLRILLEQAGLDTDVQAMPEQREKQQEKLAVGPSADSNEAFR